MGRGRLRPQDHPRACGEHEHVFEHVFELVGSSPRMRGAHRVDALRHGHDGIIPAHAGSTEDLGATGATRGDHPRACGEHRQGGQAPQTREGSSPRMRGAPQMARRAHRHEGIIPAHAGSTSCLMCPPTKCRDHPRACGEHFLSLVKQQTLKGSSPRMRGALPTRHLYASSYRIIPAHAGSTIPSPRNGPWPRDHPRACGEHITRAMTRRAIWGSSPRMRGALRGEVQPFYGAGIIPAHAGSTAHVGYRYRPVRDHPRACGEHRPSRGWTNSRTGSSPRMRGAPLTGAMQALPDGIIPAHAGSTLNEVHRFCNRTRIAYGCQGSTHCPLL